MNTHFGQSFIKALEGLFPELNLEASKFHSTPCIIHMPCSPLLFLFSLLLLYLFFDESSKVLETCAEQA